MRKSLKIWVFCFSCLLLVSWDKTTKEMAKEHLKNKGSISYFHDTFRLVYVENTGAAMSLGDSLPGTASFWLLSILPLMILVSLFIYVIRKSDGFSVSRMLVFALIIAGGSGNILDRLLFDRHVTDFMNIGVDNIRTGIFNFADVWVTAGAIALIIVYRKRRAPDDAMD
jgi:signal peptidase II